MLIAYLKNVRQKLRNRPAAYDPSLGRNFDMAIQLAKWGDTKAAINILKDCIEKHPDLPALHFHVGEMLNAQGNAHEAATAYTQCLVLDPTDPHGAGIKLFLLGVHAQGATLPPEYVRNLFDQYAQSFESCLVQNLEYTAPTQVANVVYQYRKKFDHILDLGCGTGLTAIPFRAHADYIDGVDISAGMLEKAREKKIYNALHHMDVGVFFKSVSRQYDLVLSVDTLIYLGNCDDIFKSIQSVLTPDGLFACTIQTSQIHDVILGADHRYAHSRGYIERCAHAAGLKILSCEDTVLRKEQGEPVNGMIFVCGRI